MLGSRQRLPHDTVRQYRLAGVFRPDDPQVDLVLRIDLFETFQIGTHLTEYALGDIFR